MDPGDWPLFLVSTNAAAEYWKTADREGLPAGAVPYIPMHLSDFMQYITEALLRSPGLRFLDVGAGPGLLVRVAAALGLAAHGIEIQKALVYEANRHRPDDPLVTEADARTWDRYGEWDIVLLNRPVDGQQMPAFERMVMAALRPGTVLIHANGWINPGEQLDWWPVYVKSESGPVTGVWQKPAESPASWATAKLTAVS